MPAFTLSRWRAIHAASWRAASRLRSRTIAAMPASRDAVAERLVAARTRALRRVRRDQARRRETPSRYSAITAES